MSIPETDLTLEITPPRGASRRVLLRRAELLVGLSDRINVIERPDRWPSLEAAEVLARAGHSAVWHLANRGAGLGTIEAALERAARAGLRRVLCIRGEHKAEDGVDTPKIHEVVRLTRRAMPEAEVGVSFSPESPSLERAYSNLWPKLEAGARRVQLQVCFDAAALRRAAERIRERHRAVEVVPMAMPALGSEALRRVSRRLSIPEPPGLAARLLAGGAVAGWRVFSDLARTIRTDPRFGGLAIMTPVDPGPTYAAALRVALSEAGFEER